MPLAPYARQLSTPALPITPASPKADIIRLQEWFVTRGYDIGLNRNSPGTPGAVGIDGDMGNATLTACRNFAHDFNFKFGEVDADFWMRLSAPLTMAMSYKPRSTEFGEAMVETAKAHLLQKPREARTIRDGIVFGLDNSGPWPAQYNRGALGAWCLGFVNTIGQQVADALGVAPPISPVIEGIWCLWVPRMVDEARASGRLQLAEEQKIVPPGSHFYERNPNGNSAISHIHTGIVVRDNGTTVDTIEGNTNLNGTNEGIEVDAHNRRRSNLDFGIVS